MSSPFKKKLFSLLGLLGFTFLLTLTSCGVEDDSNTDDPDVTITDPIEPNEDLTVPEQSDVTQIYLKQALTNLKVGQTLNLTDYIGVLPGRSEDQDATSFTASILL